ncbi:MAG: peptide antibiotic transporter SbmA [Salinibacterium sp.]|nr:peptide antibiotic transporter SbmA [Salinibacterium sp.]
MFRSFFPAPRLFFPAAILWAAFCVLIWFTIGPALQSVISLGPVLALPTTEGSPPPFFDTERVWLYQYVLMSGYLFCLPWYFIGGNRRWYWWSTWGTVTIVEVVFFNVQISAWLNDWYGRFYDLIQTTLSNPGTTTLDDYLGFIWTVAVVLGVNITVLVLNAFFQSHYLFRWRRAMSFYYMTNWPQVRGVEGAAQRVQEDTQQFSSIVEDLGLSFVDAIMTLLVFLPILWGLSARITELPWIGHVDGSLVWVALVSAAFGTALLWAVGLKLPGLTFQNQRVEAAFRKELVYGEDHPDRADPPTVADLFRTVQRNYFRLYFHYLYFNVARYAYLQFSVFFPYIAMAPSIITATITFGIFQQVLQAFGQVSDSFRFLVNSWTSIIRLLSVHRRLHAFEEHIPPGAQPAMDYDDPRYLATASLYQPAAMSEVSGEVSSVDYSGDQPILVVGDQRISLADVVAVRARVAST